MQTDGGGGGPEAPVAARAAIPAATNGFVVEWQLSVDPGHGDVADDQ
jgi:hypothetical protein